MPTAELAIVKQVWTFIETKIALIITKYWVEDAFPSKSCQRSKNSTLAASPCRVVAAVADGLTEPTKESQTQFNLEEARTNYMDNNISRRRSYHNHADSHIIHVRGRKSQSQPYGVGACASGTPKCWRRLRPAHSDSAS